MNMRKKVIFGVCLVTLLGFCGCSAPSDTNLHTPTAGLEKMGTITIVSREEGSGTRSSFAALLDVQSDTMDLPGSNAVVANNADEVISIVEKDSSAIGYVSLGALNDAQNVKILSIDQAETKEKRYLLSRSFYLAYCGERSDLESDFLTYIHSAGQEIVAASYTAVAKRSTFLSNQASGTITISGSTSVAPLIEALARAYGKYNPNAVITVLPTDSRQGLTSAMSGQCDFGMSSRDLEEYEQQLLDYTIIAEDSIAVIVNRDNPLENMTSDTLKNIYMGSIKTWDEIK